MTNMDLIFFGLPLAIAAFIAWLLLLKEDRRKCTCDTKYCAWHHQGYY